MPKCFIFRRAYCFILDVKGFLINTPPPYNEIAVKQKFPLRPEKFSLDSGLFQIKV